MSILIDDLVKKQYNFNDFVKYEDDWYIAKPIQPNFIKILFKRLKDAFRVIMGQSFAVHYKEDEIKK